MRAKKTLTIIQKNYDLALWSGAAFLILDTVTKAWVSRPDFRPMMIIDNIFYIIYQQNTGIAFGIPIPSWIQVITSVIILAIMFYISKEYVMSKTRHQVFKPVLFGIIIGGAIGNLLNRMIFGYVIDFIAIRPFSMLTVPIFNIADLGVTIGLITLFIITIPDLKTT